ncbi:MAG: FAD-dependent oxidoreductase, partial [Verrucomicrobiota bacterium]
LDALDLQTFEPGALVWKTGQLRPVLDVFRRPATRFSSAFQPIGTLFDKLLVARLRAKLIRKPVEEIWTAPLQTTGDYLRQFGFSDRMIDDFFRSFYGGIFLEDLLVTSSRIFEFTFKMFSMGSATLPAKGMQAIPEQLAARLSDGTIRLKTPARAISEGVIEAEGLTLTPDHIVVATDGEATSELVPGTPQPKWNSTSCLYFSAEKAPWTEPVIALKGDRGGLINNCSVPSVISPDYCEGDQALISVSVLGDHRNDENLSAKVQTELTDWFGEDAKEWKLIRVEHIRKALPIDPPGHAAEPKSENGMYLCGDTTTSGSIEGAILSGLRTADLILGKDE